MVQLLKTRVLGLPVVDSSWPATASAQTAILGGAVVPGSVDPGTVAGRFPTRPEPTPTPAEPATPPSTEPVVAEAQELIFELEQLQILGSTLYSPERFDDLIRPLLAKRQVSVADIQTLVRALRARYQQDGYTLVRIRRLLFGFTGTGYIVRIKIVEGHVEELTLPEGISETQRTLYRGYATKLQAARPLSDRV